MLLHTEDEARAFVAARCASAAAFEAVDTFATRLVEGSRSQNLIAASTIPSLWLRHLADSAQLLDHVSRETDPWIDFGAGAGLPGLVVAMMRPDRAVVLIESRGLRIQWLTEIITEFSLLNCRVLGADVRRIATFEAGVISARAFAPLPRLVELSARFSTNATEWVLPKGRSAEQDIASLPAHLRTRFHVKHSVTDAEARILTARGQLRIDR